MMVIALNGKILQTPEPAGPERFTYSLYSALFNKYKDQTFYVYYQKLNTGSLIANLMEEYPNVKYIRFNGLFSWTHIGLSNQLFKDKPDFYYSPEHTLPLFYPRHTKFISMIHGLEIRSNKQLSNKSWRYHLQWNLLKYICKISKLIITPSEYTRDQIIEANLLSNAQKIQIIHEGVSDVFRKQYDPEQIEDIKREYKLEKDYLLYVSTLQPRKNVSGLVKAYAMACKNSQKVAQMDLVLAGKKGWGYQEIFDTIINKKLESSVKHLGWFPQEKLHLLFAGASGFVFFSFEEGFSLSVLEAMTIKIPCAVSSIPQHKILGKDAVIYADPTNIEDISKAIISLVEDDSKHLIEKAYEYSQNYTWDNAAKSLMDSIKNLV